MPSVLTPSPRALPTLRNWLLAMACLTLPAQAQDKPRVIGYLSVGSSPSRGSEALRRQLLELGWSEGRNLHIEWRWAGSQPERLQLLAHQLVQLKVELIVASSTPAIAAAKQATGSIPIIMGAAADAEESGFVQSLARPGGNITGVSLMMPTLAGKRLQLLKELMPGLQRVAYLGYASGPSTNAFHQQTSEAAKSMKIAVQPVIANSERELPAAFATMQKARAQAVIVHPLFTNNLGLGPKVAELAAAHRLPSISDGTGYAEAGGLIYYGPDLASTFSGVAGYVDRVLKGGRPADMAVEQPRKFQLILNAATARRLGVDFPVALHMRADKVIE